MIRFLLEGYIDLFLSSLVGLEMITKIDLIVLNFYDCFAMLLTLFFYIMTIGLPILACYVITKKIRTLEISEMEQTGAMKYHLKLKEKTYDSYFAVFYVGLKQRSNYSVQYMLVYIIRRMAFVMIAYSYQEYMFLQL
jgi:hypothetical protein